MNPISTAERWHRNEFIYIFIYFLVVSLGLLQVKIRVRVKVKVKVFYRSYLSRERHHGPLGLIQGFS